jgi:hypothetical protein
MQVLLPRPVVRESPEPPDLSKTQSKEYFMKQYLRHYGVLFTLLILSTGSTAALAADGTPVMSRIQKSGELVLGTSGNMPPMTFKQADGTLNGFDISMAELMADVMKVKLVTKVMPFGDLIPALKSGKVDGPAIWKLPSLALT